MKKLLTIFIAASAISLTSFQKTNLFGRFPAKKLASDVESLNQNEDGDEFVNLSYDAQLFITKII